MKRVINIQIIIIILFLLSGCGVYMNIYTDYDHSVDFTKYKSFAWLAARDTTNNAYNNQIMRNNTRNYFSYAFAERGYNINVDSPDVFLDLIVTNVLTRELLDVPAYNPLPNWYICNPYYQACPPFYYYQYPYYYNYSTTYAPRYMEYMDGSITLNVIDRKENKLVWTGTANGDLYDPEYMEDNLHPAVYLILNKYPVKPTKKAKASGE